MKHHQISKLSIVLPFVLFATSVGAFASEPAIPPSWEILPIPRYVDYGSQKEFLTLGKVAIVRKDAGAYQTRRDSAGNLIGDSTITEEELTAILKTNGVANVQSVSDDLKSYADFDTLILLGNPDKNALTGKMFKSLKLDFAKWDDRNTPEHDFNTWKDFGREGYLLKVGKARGKNIIILAGYDIDDTNPAFQPGAGTFYALQSFRQLLVKTGDSVKVKTVEVADKPLMQVRGAYAYFDQNFDTTVLVPYYRTTESVVRSKMNQSVMWYGSPGVAFQVEAASKFRYPWRDFQLKFFAEYGKFCRERFVTLSLVINPDHYQVDWAAPKTFDGSKKDPLHYAPGYQAEPEFKNLWAKAGYEVSSDIDILAAKFAQANKAIGGGMMPTVMNEDDGFGLIHAEDKKYFNTDTGDKKQDSINYGKARAEFFSTLYKRVRAIAPDSVDMIPMDPPGQLVYQVVVDRNEAYSREFLNSFSTRLKELGLQDKIPIMTTGGGTAAEVVTDETIDNYKGWCNGAPMIICDNSFPFGFHVGAYETDPKGPRSPHQINKNYPAGFRDKNLYKRLLGVQWNGIDDQEVLVWATGQYLWNMLENDREKINALATRKVSTEKSYLLVKSFYDEFNQPACYLPDNPPPLRLKTVSKRIVFPTTAKSGWVYDFSRTDAMRLECQRLRDKLATLMPQLAANWEKTFERDQSLKAFGENAINFCDVYLAYGYIKGWQNATSSNLMTGAKLRDLYLEADDIQERFFAGPDVIPGKITLVRNYYAGALPFLYTDGSFKGAPATPKEAALYVDIWQDGLRNQFFQPLSAVSIADVTDGDARLVQGWGKVEEAETNKFRTIASQGSVRLEVPDKGRLMVRVKIGTGTAGLNDATPISFSAGDATHTDAVSKPRWITWLLPEGNRSSELAIHAAKPVRVYAVESWSETNR